MTVGALHTFLFSPFLGKVGERVARAENKQRKRGDEGRKSMGGGVP